MEDKKDRTNELTATTLTSLGEYAIHELEHPKNEVDIRSDMLQELKKEVTLTKRFTGAIPQDDPDLENMASYFNRQKEIVDEVVEKPHVKADIEFTIKFITSNQQRINTILKQ